MPVRQPCLSTQACHQTAKFLLGNVLGRSYKKMRIVPPNRFIAKCAMHVSLSLRVVTRVAEFRRQSIKVQYGTVPFP
ncbi:hypothetical protein TNCT_615711 [Trichonephila clavata]|uniref:Uncharacterized protein n=1 Tax=Trichonephila clavata TaxID=2740835 RepID=A0A8X6JKJ5_TRICU|nr:hypothetical protein TNCT_615711 [Trichonephila clavata]